MFGLNIFLVAVTMALGFGWTYLGKRLTAPYYLPKFLRWGILGILGVMFALPIVATLTYRHGILQHFQFGNTFFWISYIVFGFLFLCFILSVFVDVIRIISRIIQKRSLSLTKLRSKEIQNSTFHKIIPVLILTCGLALMTVGVQQALKSPVVKELDIPIKNLPKEFAGFRIVQITDLHLGPMRGTSFFEDVIQQVNNLKPDAVVITGDLVDGTVESVRDIIDPIIRLRAQDGVHFVAGNHEYYWDAKAWIEVLKSMGVLTLVNENHVIHRQGAELAFIGLPDFWRGPMFYEDHKPNMRKAREGITPAAVTILLSHNPEVAEFIDDVGGIKISFVISGHTHGGQFYPIINLFNIIMPYVEGLFWYHDTWIYVSPGTGFWGPPIRIGTTPEISVFNLVPR